MKGIGKKENADFGVQHVVETSREFSEMCIGCSKRKMIKRVSCTRGMTHGKLLTVTLKNNKVSKKNNPDHTTTHKRKKDEFDAKNCITFRNEQGKKRSIVFFAKDNRPEFKVEFQVKCPRKNRRRR